MNRPLRDILIFAVATAAVGWIGLGLNSLTGATNPMEGLGTLVWLAGPALVGLALSIFAGGWVRRLGLDLGGARAAPFYVLAILATPVVFALVAFLGLATGAMRFGVTSMGMFGGLVLAGLSAAAVKNVFEELAWRGFLTPRFVEAGVPRLANHVLTGLIWASWHVPYWLFFVDREAIVSNSGLTLGPFVALAFVTLPMQAIFYGELRLATGSVWPVFLLHTVANGLESALLTGGLLMADGPWATVLGPSTGGVVYSLLLCVLGLTMAGWTGAKRLPGGEQEVPS